MDKENNPHGNDTKDDRQKYSKTQLHQLEKEFLTAQYPSRDRYKHLAKEMAVSERKIQVWFQNRRARHRRHQRKVSGIPEDPLPLMHQRLTSTYRNLSNPYPLLNKKNNLTAAQENLSARENNHQVLTPKENNANQELCNQTIKIRKSVRSLSDVNEEDLFKVMQNMDWSDDNIFDLDQFNANHFII